MGKNRTKLPLRLDDSLAKRLDRASEETGTNRSFIVLQSLQGLPNIDIARVRKKRFSRRDVCIPNEIKRELKQLAQDNGVSQQSILRYRLTRFLKDHPWRQKETAPETSATEGAIL